MKIAITGGAGHLGINIIHKLLATSHRITALGYKDFRAFQGLDVEVFKGNILESKDMYEFTRDVDIAIHSAASISIQTRNKLTEKTNIEGTANILKACKKNKVKRLIYISSIHVFDPFPEHQPLDENRPYAKPQCSYDASKIEAEKMVLSDTSEVEKIVLNPTAMIGPYDYKPSLMGKTLIYLYRNKLPALIKGIYNWADVRDVADAVVSSMEKGKNGERYLLGGFPLSIAEISRTISEKYGTKNPALLLPVPVVKAALPFYRLWCLFKGETPLYTAVSLKTLAHGFREVNSEKARKFLDYHPRHPSLAIIDAIEWFKQNKMI